jgi:uncharacterized protein
MVLEEGTMRGLLGAVLALTVMSASFGAQAAGPSFNCKHAKKGAERMVCSSEELSALDLELVGLYGRTQSNFPSGTRSRRRKSSAIGCSTAMLAVLPSNAS